MFIERVHKWIEFTNWDFLELGSAFEQEMCMVTKGFIGNASSKLMAQKPFVDFAVRWFSVMMEP